MNFMPATEPVTHDVTLYVNDGSIKKNTHTHDRWGYIRNNGREEKTESKRERGWWLGREIQGYPIADLPRVLRQHLVLFHAVEWSYSLLSFAVYLHETKTVQRQGETSLWSFALEKENNSWSENTWWSYNSNALPWNNARLWSLLALSLCVCVLSFAAPGFRIAHVLGNARSTLLYFGYSVSTTTLTFIVKYKTEN